MAGPHFGFSITPGEALGVSQEVAQAEALGYDRIGIWDSPALFREPWVTLAAAARDSQRIALGPWVTNPLSRHPVVTASAAATLDALALGRTYIGIGSGDTGVMHLGLRAANCWGVQPMGASSSANCSRRCFRPAGLKRVSA